MHGNFPASAMPAFLDTKTRPQLDVHGATISPCKSIAVEIDRIQRRMIMLAHRLPRFPGQSIEVLDAAFAVIRHITEPPVTHFITSLEAALGVTETLEPSLASPAEPPNDIVSDPDYIALVLCPPADIHQAALPGQGAGSSKVFGGTPSSSTAAPLLANDNGHDEHGKHSTQHCEHNDYDNDRDDAKHHEHKEHGSEHGSEHIEHYERYDHEPGAAEAIAGAELALNECARRAREKPAELDARVAKLTGVMRTATSMPRGPPGDRMTQLVEEKLHDLRREQGELRASNRPLLELLARLVQT